jgi:hypothetical protein
MSKRSDKPNYLSLQPSEMAVFRAAATIYSAYVSSGQVNDDNAHEYHVKSIKEAVRLASIVEKTILSDTEL